MVGESKATLKLTLLSKDMNPITRAKNMKKQLEASPRRLRKATGFYCWIIGIASFSSLLL